MTTFITQKEQIFNKYKRSHPSHVALKQQNMDKVFRPKFTTKTSGMGLGLAMVKNIVETYNGTITFKSVKDQGTVFTVTLPKR